MRTNKRYSDEQDSLKKGINTELIVIRFVFLD